jgi:hypothetical protein
MDIIGSGCIVPEVARMKKSISFSKAIEGYLLNTNICYPSPAHQELPYSFP